MGIGEETKEGEGRERRRRGDDQGGKTGEGILCVQVSEEGEDVIIAGKSSRLA